MRWRAVMAAGLGLAVAMPAAATRHHAPSRATHARSAESSRHADDAHKGAQTVPAGGIRLFCPARRNPLLVRKMTQGAGTTVTVVCR